MIPTASPETQPVRPSRAAAIAGGPTATTNRPTPTGPALPVAGAPEPRTADPDLRSTRGLTSTTALQSGSEVASTESPETRRANVRAHVTRRLTALQSMDASMQAALMRIAQMRQLAMRGGRGRTAGDGVDAAHAADGGSQGLSSHDHTSPSSGLAVPGPVAPAGATLASVFAELERDIEHLVVGQLGGYFAASSAQAAEVSAPAASRVVARPAGPNTSAEDDAPGANRSGLSSGSAPGSSGRARGRAASAGAASARRPSSSDGRPSQRVHLQVAAGTADVPTPSLTVSGEVDSDEGATALLADLELLAQQIAGARASIQAAVDRLQRDANQSEPPPVRALGSRRRQSSEGSAQPELARARKGRPEDPIAVVRARLAMAIAAQANTSPEAAMRLL
jgi:hypothetical protein